MEKIMIINGSPRAPSSNSQQYAALFSKVCWAETSYFNITKTNHTMLCQAMEGFSDVLFAFPLYTDGIPVILLNFLKSLEKAPPQHRPVISVLINCGFLEPAQNDTAVKIMQFYCKENGYPFGSVLKIGGGEAILKTPFRILVHIKIKRLATSIIRKKYCSLQVTMPISKKMFLKASAVYWESRGKQNGITKAQMADMQIEGPTK